MKMIDVFKEETDKSLKIFQEKKKELKETNKNFQDLKMEIEKITKTQTEQILEVKNLEIKTRITDENLYQQNTKERREKLTIEM